MVTVYPFYIRYLSEYLVENDHLMWDKASLSDQCQEEIGIIIINLSLMNNDYKTTVTKLCCDKMLIICDGVWNVGDYIACLDVEDSVILIDHE